MATMLVYKEKVASVTIFDEWMYVLNRAKY